MKTDKRILVVDDSAVQRGFVKESLHLLGLKNVVEADDGNTALAKLRKEKIDLVLSDWNMPAMNGLELLKTVRSDPKLKNTAFVMVTLEGQREKILEGVRAGVSDYIVKPVTARILGQKLEKVFGENGERFA